MNTQDELSHDRLLQEMFMHVHNTYREARGLYFHVSNEFKPFPGESKQSIMIRLNRLKAIGTVPGIMDHLFYWNGALYAWDAKVGKDKLNDEQLAFIDRLRKNGGDGWEVREETLHLFKAQIKSIVNGKS